MTTDLLASLAGALENGRHGGPDGILQCAPGEEALLAACLEAALPLAGTAALVITPGAPACSGPLFELPRRAARAGCRVERLYLLAEPALAADDALRHHLALDREAGIHASLLDIGAPIAAHDSPIAPLLDCTLWHGADGGGVLMSGTAGTGWTLSGRPADITARRALIDDVRRTGAPVEPVAESASRAAGLREPLLSSAPLARLAAPVLCRRGEGENCSWYHGYWQYLRLLGTVAAPERHAGFYARALGGLAASGDYRRVLISANADYAMLAHLLLAYGDDANDIEITVVDICETPLMLCKWYGARHGARIVTRACDIVQWQTKQEFDLIVTHSFLQMMPAPARQSLVANWRQVLRPGGEMSSPPRASIPIGPRRVSRRAGRAFARFARARGARR